MSGCKIEEFIIHDDRVLSCRPTHQDHSCEVPCNSQLKKGSILDNKGIICILRT